MATGEQANALYSELSEDVEFDIPQYNWSDPAFTFPFDEESPLYKKINTVNTEDLTSRCVNGTGVFDALMESVGAHLVQEFKGNRITGNEYTKAYIASLEASMGNATQFLLGKDRSFWEAQTAQINAIRARVELETAKATLAATQFQALTQKAEYALTKMRILNEKSVNDTAIFNLMNILPSQHDLLELQKIGQGQQNDGLQLQNETADYNLTYLLPQQLVLLSEQVESQRAQTLDTRTDGTAILGSIGKQKELYSEQITSYRKDAQLKAAKMFSDAWITQKTLDEGLVPPSVFTNTTINTVFSNIRTANNL